MASFKAAATRLVERASATGRRFRPWQSRPTASTGSSSAESRPEPAAGEVRDLVEAATGDSLARAAMAGEADVDRAVEAARSAVEGDWGRTPGTERSRLLHALADAIQANRAELAELEVAQRRQGDRIRQGRAPPGRRELPLLRLRDRDHLRALQPDRWLAPLLLAEEPVGVAAQDRPWNYPLMMATWKLGSALAAGCAVVLKPDPQTPLTAIRLAELAGEVGFPAGALNVVPGDGPNDGRLPRQAPRRRQDRVHGVDEDGRRDHAPGVGSGETCHARARRPSTTSSSRMPISRARCRARPGRSSTRPARAARPGSRMLVEKPLYDEAVSRMAELAGGIKVGDPLDPETQMGSLVSTAHRDRVHGFVERAGDGVEVLCGRFAAQAARRVLSAHRRRGDERDRDRAGGGLPARLSR